MKMYNLEHLDVFDTLLLYSFVGSRTFRFRRD